METPSNSVSDTALASSFLEGSVLMQVSSVRTPTDVPAKLARDEWNLSGTTQPLSMAGVTPPLAPLRERARALGFVDVRTDELNAKVEVVGRVGSHPVASLQLAIIELALGVSARVENNTLNVGKKTFALDEKGRVACDSMMGKAPHAYGIDDLLSGTIRGPAIRNKVVVLGYGRKDSPKVKVAGQEIVAHMLFYRQVACLGRLVVRE